MMGDSFKYHWLPAAAFELSVTEPPSQNDIGPPAAATGEAGEAATVKVPFSYTIL
jgi:hypothetical protein